MNKQDATSTLQNVLEACESGNITPIDEMLSSKITASKGYNKYIYAVILAIVITLFTPLLFVATAEPATSPTYHADIAVDDYYVQDGCLYIDLHGSFIDFTSIYAVSASGSTVFPLEYNSNTGLVSFLYDETEWNIYVSDLNNVTVHMLLTPPQ